MPGSLSRDKLLGRWQQPGKKIALEVIKYYSKELIEYSISTTKKRRLVVINMNNQEKVTGLNPSH